MTAVLYSLPACVQCTYTERAFDAAEIPYRKVDMSQDEEAAETVRDLGYMSAPVVVAGDEHWSGFQPDRIAALAAA